MQTSLDLPKIESYSVALSEKLCNEFYKEDVATISGAEILTFSPIEQLNLFIVKNLFDRWREESFKLRSPYFDYEQEDVKAAMTIFLNKLSKHISIRKEFFKPLLRKAISDSICYLVNPYLFIKVEFLSKPIISLAELMEKEKYIKINKFLVQRLIKKLQLQNKTGFTEQEVNHYFEEVYKNFESSLENIDRIAELFSSLLKVNFEELMLSKNGTSQERISPALEPAIQPFHREPSSSIPQDFSQKVKEQHSPITTLNDMFAKKNQLSLNDMLMKDDETSVVAKNRKSKIHDLKSSVPINLRFIFINELFKGSGDDYELALSQVERCEDYVAAKNILDQVYGRKYDWNLEKTETKEFLELIERRFY